MSSVQNYLLSVSAAALLMSFLLALVPNGRIRYAVKFLGSLLVVLAVISPVIRFDAEDISRSIAKFRMEKEQLRTGIEIKNRDILAELIKDGSEAYILDKAEEMGVTLSVDIVLREEGDYPYPIFVTLYGTVTEADRLYFEKMIEQDIGIPPERQEWVTSE